MTARSSDCCVWTWHEDGRRELRIEMGDAECIFKFDREEDLIEAVHNLQEEARLALECLVLD